MAGSDRTALRRFITLFGAVEGDDAGPVREAWFRLAVELARASGRRHALEVELLLHTLQAEEAPELRARALDERARLLTRHGLLAEATDCYRRLAKEYPGTVVHDDKTAGQVLNDLSTDKRFLVHLESKGDPWAGARFKPVVTPGGLAVHSLSLPCVPCRVRPQGDGRTPPDVVSEQPDGCRRLRFTLDGSRLQLRVADRATGAELYVIPLPLTAVPPALRDGEVYYQAVDHLLVLCVGPNLLGIDLLERRVRWTRQVVDDYRLLAQNYWVPSGDGGVFLNVSDEGMRRVGLTGPVGPSAICVQTRHGLIALDPATGDVRWGRADVPRDLSVFGDEDHLFLVERTGEGGVRGVRAVRARDGLSVSIPDAVAACAKARRFFGRFVLVIEAGADERQNLRLYDPLAEDRGRWRVRAAIPGGALAGHCRAERHCHGGRFIAS
jgi:hypothetical protein